MNHNWYEYANSNINFHLVYAMLHGDSAPRVGGAPPSLLAPRGLGGFWGNVSQRPQNQETLGNLQGGASPYSAARSGEGGLPHAPSRHWGLLDAPHDFPKFSLKKQNFNFNCCLVSISGLVFSNLLFHYFSMQYHWFKFSITMTEIRNMNIQIQMTNLKIIMMNCITCLYY